MSLYIARVKLELDTDSGPFGFDFSFAKGLNVVRAENSHGKTTCALSIIYALGLEGTFGSTQQVSLSEAATKQLLNDGKKVNVIQSHVYLEITNNVGRRATLRRGLIGTVNDHRIVEVWEDHVLANKAVTIQSRPYFVRIPGSAIRENGFHTWLCKFLSWEMPSVPTFDV